MTSPWQIGEITVSNLGLQIETVWCVTIEPPLRLKPSHPLIEREMKSFANFYPCRSSLGLHFMIDSLFPGSDRLCRNLNYRCLPRIECLSLTLIPCIWISFVSDQAPKFWHAYRMRQTLALVTICLWSRRARQFEKFQHFLFWLLSMIIPVSVS